MKIIHYNILDGCLTAPERLAGVLGWLKGEAADLVTLNELNGWHGHAQRYARRSGYAHATLCESAGSPYHLGVMTREKHEVVLHDETSFHHGLLGITYRGITVLITHLTPISSADRRSETDRLGQLVDATSGPVLVVGDLNTLSPLDRDDLMRPHVIESLRSTGSLARKFLDDSGHPDFVPMETLLAAGLTDLGVRQKGRHTVPTPFNRDAAHALPLRLDYMLANAAFLENWTPNAEVLRTPVTDRLSDHYPLCCEAAAT